MSISCTYPDKDSDAEAMTSGSFAEELAQFDLSHQYTVFVEEELCLFFAKVFNRDILNNPFDVSDDKGVLVETEKNMIMYYWDDIPVVQFALSSEMYGGYVIRCSRLYEVEGNVQN
jgi:hypothetical protein